MEGEGSGGSLSIIWRAEGRACLLELIRRHYQFNPPPPSILTIFSKQCCRGSWARLRKYNNPNLCSQLITSDGKQSLASLGTLSACWIGSCDTQHLTLKRWSWWEVALRTRADGFLGATTLQQIQLQPMFFQTAIQWRELQRGWVIATLLQLNVPAFYFHELWANAINPESGKALPVAKDHSQAEHFHCPLLVLGHVAVTLTFIIHL